jgi:RNA polymerase sigma-70 factor, ECF subfamily
VNVLDDEDFVSVLAAARCGEAEAFTSLFESLARPVAGYLRGRAVEDPDGAANEVFLRVFTRITDFDGDAAKFRSWVFTIARNLAIDEQRARARRATIVAIDEYVAQLAGHPDPDDVIARDSVDAMLARLSRDQRDVILLRFVADLSIEETAAVVAKRVTAVKALQRRALDALRKDVEAPASVAPAPA